MIEDALRFYELHPEGKPTVEDLVRRFRSKDKDGILAADDDSNREVFIPLVTRLMSGEPMDKQELEHWRAVAVEDNALYWYFWERAMRWQVIVPLILQRLTTLEDAH